MDASFTFRPKHSYMNNINDFVIGDINDALLNADECGDPFPVYADTNGNGIKFTIEDADSKTDFFEIIEIIKGILFDVTDGEWE